LRAAKKTILFSGIGSLIVAVIALIVWNADVSLGVVIGWCATAFSLVTVMSLARALTGVGHVHKGRNLAWLWALVKLPVLAGACAIVVALGEAAVWSFLGTVSSVYSLLLCVAWLESRAPGKSGRTSKNDIEPS
jgi:cyanate permease